MRVFVSKKNYRSCFSSPRRDLMRFKRHKRQKEAGCSLPRLCHTACKPTAAAAAIVHCAAASKRATPQRVVTWLSLATQRRASTCRGPVGRAHVRTLVDVRLTLTSLTSFMSTGTTTAPDDVDDIDYNDGDNESESFRLRSLLDTGELLHRILLRHRVSYSTSRGSDDCGWGRSGRRVMTKKKKMTTP